MSLCEGCSWSSANVSWLCSPQLFNHSEHWICREFDNSSQGGSGLLLTCSWASLSAHCGSCDPGSPSGGPSCGKEPPENTFELPWWRQIFWYSLFGLMVLFSTAGNSIVIWIVLSQKRMRTVTNYFIVNLSIADIMLSILNVTFNFIYMVNGHWPFGEIYCKVSPFISVISVCGSVFTLVAISLDRYNAIIRPLKPRFSRLTTILIASGIWIVAIIIATPQMLYFTTKANEEENRIICYSSWPDGEMNKSNLEYIYNVFFMILTYFFPMVMLILMYVRIGFKLWGSQVIGEETDIQRESVKSKKRVVKMIITIVVIFAVCWAPYHAYFILSNLIPEINFTSYIQELYLGIYWIAMSNSMYNPMIYCFMNNRFRQGFIAVYRKLSSCFTVCKTSSASSKNQPTGSTESLHFVNENFREESRRKISRDKSFYHSEMSRYNESPTRLASGSEAALASSTRREASLLNPEPSMIYTISKV